MSLKSCKNNKIFDFSTGAGFFFPISCFQMFSWIFHLDFLGFIFWGGIEGEILPDFSKAGRWIESFKLVLRA